uniref:Uncharacterized protein n=1 Tax=Xenopus tropicalis TaxID=8364 RepID=A0A803JN74_XENTR
MIGIATRILNSIFLHVGTASETFSVEPLTLPQCTVISHMSGDVEEAHYIYLLPNGSIAGKHYGHKTCTEPPLKLPAHQRHCGISFHPLFPQEKNQPLGIGTCLSKQGDKMV